MIGEFLMGSPEFEEDHDGNEKRDRSIKRSTKGADQRVSSNVYIYFMV